MPMHPKFLSIEDFTYSLREERIANYPLPERDASKLLIYDKGNITEDIYRNLVDHFPEHALIVFNDTKVIEARLLFHKPSGATIEIFCLEPHEQYMDITTAMSQKREVLWQCLVGGASKWKPGQVLEKRIKAGNAEIILNAVYVEKKPGSFTIKLSWSPTDYTFAEIIHHAGAIPLPPYIKREVEAEDAERYQTMYADHEGSVAAPTAGLHFTQTIFDELAIKNIESCRITLHVGAGTFKPVKSATMEDHLMHAEFMEVPRGVIHRLMEKINEQKSAPGHQLPIIAVGTTSLRAIESLYWLGVQLLGSSQKSFDSVGQWEPYDQKEQNIPASVALQALLDKMDNNRVENLRAKTQIIIAPGYNPRIVNTLVTNFHQPKSTLLLLVAAFIGDDWKRVYEYALKNEFRFLSYGDGCLLVR
jgi:S-adenosylmethionine:tRNA ribosyltransferase-isomerase